MALRTLLKKLAFDYFNAGIKSSLALHRRGEVRPDGLTLAKVSHRLEIEWRAREIHPWDRGCSPQEETRLFTEQCFSDTEAAIGRLFAALPIVDVIEFRVIDTNSEDQLLKGTVARSVLKLAKAGTSTRSRLWRMGANVSEFAIVQQVSDERSPYAHPASPPSCSAFQTQRSAHASRCDAERNPHK